MNMAKQACSLDIYQGMEYEQIVVSDILWAQEHCSCIECTKAKHDRLYNPIHFLGSISASSILRRNLSLR